MPRVSVAGLMVDAATKQQVLKAIEARLDASQRTFISTPYSEFLYASLHNRDTLDLLNHADIAVADGIGMLWAAKFLSLPLTIRSFHGKIIQALWQMKYTLAAIIFYPNFIRSVIPEKIVGAELFLDLVQMARHRKESVYLLGGFNDTPQRVAAILQQKFPGLRIAGVSNKNPGDLSVVGDIVAAKPEFLFVAYGPIRQERWIVNNWQSLAVKVGIGLGGTFDYIVGKRQNPPSIIRSAGLEWLFRLITQPRRAKRIMNATFGLLRALIRYKVFSNYPFRNNVVCVILNHKNNVLVCRRNPVQGRHAEKIRDMTPGKFMNYWQLPQGGIEQSEEVKAAAMREAAEETGLSHLGFVTLSPHSYEYDWNNAHRPLWFNIYQYKGQRQAIAYLRHAGGDNEVKIDGKEFVDFQWVAPSQLPALIHPERSGLTDIIVADLPQLLENQ